MNPSASQPILPPGTTIDRRWRVTAAPQEGATARLYPAQDVRSGEQMAIALWPAAADRLPALRALQALSQAYHPCLVPLLGSGLHEGAPFAVLATSATPLPWTTIAAIPPAQCAGWLFSYADAARYLTARGLPLPAPEDVALRLDGGELRLLPLGSLSEPAGATIDAGTTLLARRLFPTAPDEDPSWWPSVAALRATPRPLSALLAELGQALGRNAVPPPLLPPLRPFAGREQPLAQLTAALARLADGSGGAFLIGGGSGSGKSRLVDEVALRARGRDLDVRYLREAPNSYESVGWPMLLQLLGEPSIAETEQTREESQWTQRTLTRRVQEQVQQITRTQALLLIIEDADQLALEMRRLLEHLLPLAAARPLLLIITYRNDLLPELPRRFRRAQALTLPPLDLEATTTLLEAALGPDGAAESLPNLVLQRTGGNPLLIYELLLSSAAIDGGTRGLSQALALLTGGVGALIGHRLLHLQPSERRLLQTAALLGNSVDPDLLAAFDEAPSLPAWLAAAAHLGALAHYDGAWRFTHAAVAAATAASVGLGDRPVRHAAIAARLEQQAAVSPARLAGHWLAAGDDQRGAKYARRAGDLAQQQGLPSVALRQYERSADALSSAADSVRQRELIEVVVTLAAVAGRQGNDAQGHRLTQALSLVPALQDPLLEAQLYGSVGTYHYAHGRLPQALNYLTRCLILAEAQARQDLALQPLNLLGQIFCAAGKLSASLPYLTRGAAAAQAAGDQATAARSWAYAAVAHWFRGETAAAARMRAAAGDAAAACGAADQSEVAAILGYGLAFAGLLTEAQPLLESSISRGLSRRDSPLQMLAHGVLGYIALVRGEIDSAARYLNRALEIAGTNRMATLHLPVVQALRSMIALSSGNFTAAVRGVEEALDLAEATQQPLAQAICQQILCRVLLDAPNPDWTTGEYLLLESMTYYRLEGTTPFIATVTADLGRVYFAQGHTSLAETSFSDALAQMEKLGMAWDAAQVRALLAALAKGE